MHCNGKCYLKKKIAEAEKKERSQDKESQKGRFMEAVLNPGITIDASFRYISQAEVSEFRFFLTPHQQFIFHPPRA